MKEEGGARTLHCRRWVAGWGDVCIGVVRTGLVAETEAPKSCGLHSNSGVQLPSPNCSKREQTSLIRAHVYRAEHNNTR